MSNHQALTATKSTSSQLVQLLRSTRETAAPAAELPRDLFCFSHLRWNFVYQRPQHLLSRASAQFRVWFWEEPVADDHAWLEVRSVGEQLCVAIPHLPPTPDAQAGFQQQRRLLNGLLAEHGITDFLAWYYTPMALAFTDHLLPQLTVYDCMDELAAFKGASPQLLHEEQRLLERADLVFTGGYSLYEAKQSRHERVSAFPSCIDYDHFAQARRTMPDPQDQRHLTGIRLGFSGVIDERLDLDLLRELALQLPECQFILLGPVVKIDPATLPQGPNLHYLGMKDYRELPAYFSNWDVAMLPFARNEATHYISPTKTPEYLAAGLPVVSTSIRDVIRTYGNWPQVLISDSAADTRDWVRQLATTGETSDRTELDNFLREQCWETTWQNMHQLICDQLKVAS